jgi:PKD repeat protein
VTVHWATANGTATAGSDYNSGGGTLTFNPGKTSQTVTVYVSGDTLAESNETFVVNLSGHVNVQAGDSTGTGTIVDDDANQAPTAEAGPDQSADEGYTVAFDGRGSSDPDGHALTYLWNFGDGTTADVVAPTHVFADNGVYTVTLTVSDGYGGSAADKLTVTVANVTPAAYLLYVGGTTGSDQIGVKPVGGGAVRVMINGEDLGTFTLGVSAPGNGGVIVYAQAGDDTVELVGTDDGTGNLVFPYAAALFGGADQANDADGSDLVTTT